MFNKISTKMLATISIIIIISTSVLGTISYQFAKKELISAGKLDLQHIVAASIETLELLNIEVEKGNLSLEDAKEQARAILVGPSKVVDGETTHDYSKSSYLYKKEGYLFAYDSSHKAQLHPIIPVDADKTELQSTDGKFVIKDLVSLAKNEDSDQRFYKYLWKNAGETNERAKIAYMMYFDPWDWNIGIGAYESEFYDSLNTLKFVIIGLTVFITFISFILFYLLSRGRLKLLGQVAATSLDISNGNISISNIPETKDEIGQLGKSFNTMTRQLTHLVKNIQDVSMKVSDSVTDLSALSEETTATSEEIGKAMNEISKGSTLQASEIEETSLKADSLKEAIHLMNEQKARMNQLSSSSEQAVYRGKEKVVLLRDSNNQSLVASEQIQSGIKNLINQMKEISNIVTTIDNISKQTNLLALNASIEAARAGEHGKGFAVVADEVRKLAEETNKATAEIQSMINGIEKETSTTAQTMEDSAGIISQLHEAVLDTEKEFNDISDSISQISGALEILEKEINTVTNYSGTIMESIENISSVAEETAASTEEVTASIEEQINAISTLTTAADSLNTLSDQLIDLIKHFKIK